MANLKSELLVRLIDGVSGPARKAAAALRGLNSAARSGGGSPLVAMQQRLAKASERNSRAIAVMQGKLVGVGAAGYGLTRILRPVLGSAVEFETVLEDLGQKAGMAGDQLRGIGKRITEIGKQTNQSALATAKGVDFLVGMGLGGKTDAENVENALGMSPAIGKATTAYRAQLEEVAKAAHAVFFNLKTPADQVITALDAMGKAGQQGGFELKDMAATFPALTAAAQFLGMKGVPAVADLAAALQIARTGAADGAQAANNMANFFQKLTLKETVKNFKKFGVDVYKELDYARKKGISPIEHMMAVLKKATKGDEDLISQIFGDKQVLEFIRPMWAQLERYKEIRDQALKAQGYTQEMFERRLRTSQARIDAFMLRWENMSRTIGNALLPGLMSLLDAIQPVVDAIEKFAEANPELVASLVAGTASALALSAAVLGIGLAARMANGGFLVLQGAGLMLARGLRAITVTPLIAALGAARRAMVGFAASAAIVGSRGAMRVIAGSMLALLKPANLLRGLLAGLFAMGPLGLGLAAALGAIGVALANWDNIKAFGSGFLDGFMNNLKPLEGSLKPIGDAISKLTSGLAELLRFGDPSQWRGWGEWFGTGAAEAVNTLVGAIQRVVDAFGYVIAKAAEAAAAVQNFFGSSGAYPYGGGPGAVLTNPMPAPGRVPGRAGGGRVSRGNSYLVGERRPEIFTPGQSGYVNSRVPEGGRQPEINVTNNFTVSGIPDAEAFAEKVSRIIERKTRNALRGIQADTRLGFGY